MLKILVIGLNFHPELTGIGKYSAEMAAYLASQGYDVHVVTAPPYYPHWQVQAPYRAWTYQRETWQGMRVYRCPLWVPQRASGIKRVLHLGSFALFSFPLLLLQIRWRPEVVIAVAPAIAAAPFALLTARLSGAKAWLHVQDFELEAAAGLGLLPANSLITNLARRIDGWLLARFDRVSTISQRMLERLAQKGVPAERTVLFPNWVDPDSIFPLPAEANPLQAALEIPTGKLIVLYAGNLGRKQGLEVLLEAARLLAGSSEILFVISGEGTVKAQLQADAGELPNLRFFPLQPIERLNALLNLADIHVLPQRADAADLVMPSKLLGMLASSRPVLATARPGTELARVLEGVGLVVPPEDAGALAAGILRLARDPALRARLGAQGRRLCQARWAREKVLGDFARRLSELVGK